ncbi:hypothetical protein [Sphingobium sp. CR28]|uniref:hypothetical protein n=1 Tax=Sphingobium sp. CR28 TaxID=3400272 RepID=UPI003FEE5050
MRSSQRSGGANLGVHAAGNHLGRTCRWDAAPLFDDDVVGMVKANAAIGLLAEPGIGRFGIVGAAARGFAKVIFPYCVADADQHESLDSVVESHLQERLVDSPCLIGARVWGVKRGSVGID